MSQLPQGYTPRTPASFQTAGRRHLTLDKLTTAEIYARVNELRDSNASLMTAKLRQIDAQIADAQAVLQSLLGARDEALWAINVDLADWNANQLRKVGLRKSDKFQSPKSFK